MDNQVITLIPAYNEERSIGGLISGLYKVYDAENYSGEILVISDGCTDDTVNICKKLGVRVVENKKRSGKSSALIKGLQIASKYDSLDGVTATMDGDLQHEPEFIPSFLKQLESGNVGLVIGYRLRQPLYQHASWLHRPFDEMMQLLNGRVIDYLCGYKVMPSNVAGIVLKESLKHRISSYKFGLDLQMISSVLKHGYQIVSAEIPYEPTHRKSHLNKLTFIPQTVVNLPRMILYNRIKQLRQK